MTNWFAQYSGTEFGPMTREELAQWHKSIDSTDPILVWREGFETWMPFSSVPADGQSNDVPVIRVAAKRDPAGAEKRSSSRHPFVATIAADRQVIGVCLDISDNGIMIQHWDHWTPQVGEIKRLQVVPLSICGLPRFDVKLKVMWVQVPQKRAGLHFHQIEEMDARSLVRYLNGLRKKP